MDAATIPVGPTATPTKVLGGQTYEVHYLAPEQALVDLAELAKMIAPGAGAAIEVGDVIEGIQDGTDELAKLGLARAAAQLAGGLNTPELLAITRRLAAVTLVDGVKLDTIFAVHFQGKILTLIKWLAFALSVQYADFFEGSEGLASLLGAFREKDTPA